MPRRLLPILVGTSFLLFSLTVPVHAQPPGIAEILQSIARQIQELQRNIADLTRATATTPSVTDTFTGSLQRGVRSDEVKTLQQFLKGFAGVYPEGLVTGYFGPLTERAVIRFQNLHGIPPTGNIGTQTRARLNELLAAGAGRSGIVPPGLLIAPGIGRITSGASASDTPLTTSTSALALRPKPAYDVAALALRTHELVNKRRAAAGLELLPYDQSLAWVAEDHSRDQAEDNRELTNPDLLCHYPLIRHEGFDFGFTLGARLENRSIAYRLAGENIAIMPEGKNFMYRHAVGSAPPPCQTVEEFITGSSSEVEITETYRRVRAAALAAVAAAAPVAWVNQDWYTLEEIAVRVVEGWMSSAGHRANILEPGFTAGGMGVVEVNNYLIFTHNLLAR